MTTISQRLLAIGEYKSWREEQELEGKPSGLDAYSEHLIAQEPIEKLAEVEAIVGNFEDLEVSPERWSRLLHQLDTALHGKKEVAAR